MERQLKTVKEKIEVKNSEIRHELRQEKKYVEEQIEPLQRAQLVFVAEICVRRVPKHAIPLYVIA